MNNLAAIVQKIVQQELAQQRSSLLGVVTEIFSHTKADDNHNYEASVRLKHEDLEIPKVPMAVNHMGVATPPREGDLLLVQFINGDLNQPVITGRFYHSGEQPPLHKANELLWEQRVAKDSTLNHLRFTENGTILLERAVDLDDKSKTKTSVKIDGETGDIEIKAGENIAITVTNNEEIQITADGKDIKVTCQKLSLTGDLDVKGNVKIEGNEDVNGNLKVTGGSGSTTISGNEITGA